MNPEHSQQWPLVTINILAFNRRDEVRQTLRELEKVDYPREHACTVEKRRNTIKKRHG